MSNGGALAARNPWGARPGENSLLAFSPQHPGGPLPRRSDSGRESGEFQGARAE